MDDVPATRDEQRARRDLIDQAARVSEHAGKVPEGFVAALFSRASQEDLAAYRPQDLAALAHASFDFWQTRTNAGAKIRLSNPAPAGEEPLQRITVIEAVNDDMPFLLDSVMGEIGARNLNVRLVAHPILSVTRDHDGRLTSWKAHAEENGAARRESFIHIHVERIDESRFAEITEALDSLFKDLRVCVADWRNMLDRVEDAIKDLRNNAKHLPQEEIFEAADFAQWLVDGNFTFLGCREYEFSEKNGKGELSPVFSDAFGLLRDPDVRVLRRGGTFLTLTPEIQEFMHKPVALIVTKANLRSRIHRRVYMDYIGIKRFDRNGNAVGELRIIGLFTSTAYMQSARAVPYLRRKVGKVIERAGFDPGSHSGKALLNVLESYPRDELFHIDDDLLYRFALLILELEERPRVRVLARRDRFDRYVSILVYVPRDRYDSAIRARLGDYFAEVFKGRVSAFYPFFPEGPLARVHFIIGRDEGKTPDPDRAALEAAVEDIVRSWSDDFERLLARRHGSARALELSARYGASFSAAYREAYAPESAVQDLDTLTKLSPERTLALRFYRQKPQRREEANLKVWSFQKPLPLSARVPVLEHMGFSVVAERTYPFAGAGKNSDCIYLHDMTLTRTGGGEIDLDRLQGALEAALMAVAAGRAEDDGFNALTLFAGLAWRDVALVRTLARYLRQAGVTYSQDYLWETLNKHPGIAQKIVALFYARFQSQAKLDFAGRAGKQAALAAKIEDALQAVESLDEDRILRQFVNAVQAAVRTNFFQTGKDGQAKAIIAVKFASRKLTDLPLPRPLYEIFVYSPRVEGVHLRFGKVARGGIRWSDRPQDFRTEILGLVKAQQVKNAVIVPVGAKGGFVPKLMPKNAPRDVVQAEGVATYKLFISTLLDITDNIGGDGTIVPPADVVRHEGDDPYLVVAADKGTATFSDIANGLAAEHGYWLGDAFASGGSAGYDHKAMGITARGAWESVKRHFREMDVNIHETPFTAVGVGDMSGDVFGNGMLRERTVKLLAAFDHRDIFIDPDPDPKKSFAERERLFKLPRSSWQDYDKALISKGGGVYPRSSKAIQLPPQARALLGLGESVTPPELMKAILKAPVDLLFFGGIGTYVRSSHETDADVGDRANDAIRIAGKELRCKVVGEGANLGVTQRGRVEAAQAGIRLNTDAIDNSAGVNTSDVEVNIKIALSVPVRAGVLTLEARNALLHEMTDEVARLVLRNNYQQTLALSLAQRRGLEDLGFQQRLMQILEMHGHLDRAVEFLPDDMTLSERRKRGEGLTRPELAVLLAYAKLSLYSELLDSTVPDDPYLGRELNRYFPKEMTERFADALQQHRLRREIIATQLTNSMINRGGATLVVRIADQTGASSAAIAAAFAAVRQSYGMVELNSEIDALDNRIAGARQLDLYAAVQDLLLDRIVWFMRNVDLAQGLDKIVAHYKDGIAQVEAALAGALPNRARAAQEERAGNLGKTGVPEALARRVATLPVLKAAPDIVLVADRAKKPVGEVAATYFATEAFFQLDRVAGAAGNIAVSDYFDRLALDRALDSLGDAERRITAAMVGNGQGNGLAGEGAVEAWVKPRRTEVERIRAAIHEIAGSGLTLSKLSVAASLLGDLARE